MTGVSAIEWTDVTWNPVTGCSKVSPGCANCYAETIARRFAGRGGNPDPWTPWTPQNAASNVVLHPDRLDAPLRWRKPRMVFVNSMSDLFHEQVPGSFINEVWMTIRNAKRHTYQILTKRPERLLDWTRRKARACAWPIEEIWPEYVWLGVSVENQRHTARMDVLREVPAPVRFVSCEPLLGPLDLELEGIHWVIAGGESGSRARPMHPAWPRVLRDQCLAAGVPFFFKQWGAWGPGSGWRPHTEVVVDRYSGTYLPWRDWNSDTTNPVARRLLRERSDLTVMHRTTKAIAGRELDGRTWDELPG